MVLISDLKAFFSSIYLSGALSFIQQYDNSIFYILKAMFSVETKSYFQIMMALTPPPDSYSIGAYVESSIFQSLHFPRDIESE